jgi:hypothetical protein
MGGVVSKKNTCPVCQACPEQIQCPVQTPCPKCEAELSFDVKAAGVFTETIKSMADNPSKHPESMVSEYMRFFVLYPEYKHLAIGEDDRVSDVSDPRAVLLDSIIALIWRESYRLKSKHFDSMTDQQLLSWLAVYYKSAKRVGDIEAMQLAHDEVLRMRPEVAAKVQASKA